MSEDTGNTDKNARYVNMLHWILIMKSTVPVYPVFSVADYN